MPSPVSRPLHLERLALDRVVLGRVVVGQRAHAVEAARLAGSCATTSLVTLTFSQSRSWESTITPDAQREEQDRGVGDLVAHLLDPGQRALREAALGSPNPPVPSTCAEPAPGAHRAAFARARVAAEEVGLRDRGVLELAQEQPLVRAVDVREPVGRPDQQRLRLRQRLRERADDRDRAAAPGEHHVAAPGRRPRGARRVVGGAPVAAAKPLPVGPGRTSSSIPKGRCARRWRDHRVLRLGRVLLRVHPDVERGAGVGRDRVDGAVHRRHVDAHRR